MKERYRIKKIICLFLTVLFVMSGLLLAPLSVHAEEINGTGKITTESLNVRSGPGKEYDAIGKVYASETVKVTGSENGWYLIDYNGAEGYISAKYVELSETEVLVETSASEEATTQATVDEEEVAPHGFELYKIPILVGVIVLVFIIILITLKGIRKLDDDDEYEDDEYEDEEDEEEEDDEDEYEYEERRPVRKNTKSRPRQSMYTLEEEEPVRRQPKQTRPVQQTRQPVRTQTANTQRPQKELDMILSNNPDDYRIDIDPIFFEEDKKPVSKSYEDDKKDADLQKAMEKMEELQREIERIKNKK